MARLDSKLSYGRAAAETLSRAGLPAYVAHALESCRDERELCSRLESMPEDVQYKALDALSGTNFSPTILVAEAGPLLPVVEMPQTRVQITRIDSSTDTDDITAFAEGKAYSKDQVGSILGCEMNGYLPNKDGRVICATVTKSYNPDAPDIILPGCGPQIERWGKVFCGQKNPVPIFVKASGSDWIYVGNYYVARWSAAPEQLAEQKRRSGRRDISKVLYLEKAMSRDPSASDIAHPAIDILEPPEAQSDQGLQAHKLSPVTNPLTSIHRPSPYQQQIYEFQESGHGDGFVEAVAGSGKTTTLVGCAERLPEEERDHAIFVAFNKHIAEELGTRLPSGVAARTIHAIGFRAFRKSLRHPGACEVVDRKYQWLSDHFLAQEANSRKDRSLRELRDTLTKLVHFFMVTLTDPSDNQAVRELAQRFDLTLEDSHLELMEKAVPVIVGWGQSGLSERDKRGHTYAMHECISYDDMIYLPNVLGLSMPKYRMVYCDEAQDLSAAQLEIVLNLRASGGRILFVGDPRQSIYAFAGADSGSVDTILRRTGATRLPLSVCYRCPRLHVAMAKEIVPQIEARENAPEGIFARITQNDLITKAQPDDLILCRLTAPLVETAFLLISAGKPAKVRGRDIGEDLIAVVASVERMRGYTWPGFVEYLHQYRARMMGLLRHEDADPLAITSLEDRVRTIQIIHQKISVEGEGQNTTDLKKAITDLFREETGATVLSTVHRAKGLESARVFVLQEALMPHPKATKPEQRAQEWNLRYVALTRATEELYFVSDSASANSKNKTEEDDSLDARSYIPVVSTVVDPPRLLPPVQAFGVTFLGLSFGRRIGARLGERAELVSGVVLTILGIGLAVNAAMESHLL